MENKKTTLEAQVECEVTPALSDGPQGGIDAESTIIAQSAAAGEITPAPHEDKLEATDPAAPLCLAAAEATPSIDEQTPAQALSSSEEAKPAEPAAALPEEDLEREQAIAEALIFASGEPLSADQVSAAASLSLEKTEVLLQRIKEKFSAADCGFELVAVAERFQFRTKVAFAPFLRELKADRPRRLSAAALETLSIVAYRQPIVRSDIEKIRGVDVTPTLKTLLERSLVKIVGHQPSVGQPALYGTTDEFLKLFGLSSLAELPTLRDLGELEKDPGETGEGSAAPESVEAAEAAAPEELESAAVPGENVL